MKKKIGMGNGIRDKFVSRMPKRKKGLPAGQTRNNYQKCFRSVPREAPFLRLGIFDMNLSRIPFPIPIFFSFFIL